MSYPTLDPEQYRADLIAQGASTADADAAAAELKARQQ